MVHYCTRAAWLVSMYTCGREIIHFWQVYHLEKATSIALFLRLNLINVHEVYTYRPCRGHRSRVPFEYIIPSCTVREAVRLGSLVSYMRSAEFRAFGDHEVWFIRSTSYERLLFTTSSPCAGLGMVRSRGDESSVMFWSVVSPCFFADVIRKTSVHHT